MNIQQVIQVVQILIGAITFFGGWYVANKILTNDFVHLDADVKGIRNHLDHQDRNMEKLKDSVNEIKGSVIELKTKIEERTERRSSVRS